jgi:hypothetical protein
MGDGIVQLAYEYTFVDQRLSRGSFKSNADYSVLTQSVASATTPWPGLLAAYRCLRFFSHPLRRWSTTSYIPLLVYPVSQWFFFIAISLWRH